jgi:hypothetical protein
MSRIIPLSVSAPQQQCHGENGALHSHHTYRFERRRISLRDSFRRWFSDAIACAHTERCESHTGNALNSQRSTNLARRLRTPMFSFVVRRASRRKASHPKARRNAHHQYTPSEKTKQNKNHNFGTPSNTPTWIAHSAGGRPACFDRER